VTLVTTRQEEHYNTIAFEYTKARQQNLCNVLYYEYLASSLFDLIPAALKKKDDLVILDPMCGSGELLHDALNHLDNCVSAFYGVDISENMLLLAKQEVKEDPRGKLLKGDIRLLPLPDASVDLVLIRGGLHHVYQHLNQTLEQIYRVLKPGGAFVYFEPSDDNVLLALARKILYTKHSYFVQDEEKGMESKLLLSSLKHSGFTDNQIIPFGYAAYTFIGNTDVFPLMKNLTHRPTIRSLIALDKLWQKTPLLNQVNLAILGSSTKPMLPSH